MAKSSFMVRFFFVSILFASVIVPSSFTVTWPEEEYRLTFLPFFDGVPAIAQMDDGRIWVLWETDARGNTDIAYTIYDGESYDGESWPDPVLLTLDSSNEIYPAILQADDGTIWVFWSSDRNGNYDIFYMTSSDNGLSWSNTDSLTTSPYRDNAASAVQKEDGMIWVVWHRELTGSNYDIFYTIYNGSAWSDEESLVTDPSQDRLPAIANAMDGKMWVTWCSYRTGDFEIFYKTYDGSSWSSDRRLTFSNATSDVSPSILQTLDETIRIFWSSCELTLTATEDIYCKYSRDNGVTWEDCIQITTHNKKDMWPSATQTTDTRIWVVWTSNRDDNWEIYYKYSDEMVVHDIALTHVEPATSTAKLGDLIGITVVAENQGTKEESFVVNCYADSTSIGSEQQASLNVGDSIELYFTWDTADFVAGSYIISATVSGVEGEVDREDNTLMDGIVELMEPTHDVALIDVTPTSNLVSQGNTISIDVTAQNQGTETETFSVSCFVNSTSIGSQTITLNPADSTLLDFIWDTSGFTIGKYVTIATASVVPHETDTADNTFVDGNVTVLPYRDVAITNTIASPTNVTKPEPVNINVTLSNEGELTETLNVTTYYDGIEIDSTKTDIILEAGASITINFIWDTTTVDEGTYIISAKVSVVPCETDTADNTFTDGEVTVTRPLGTPVASFTWSPLEPLVDEIVTLNASKSYDPEGGNIASYEWDFGDGTTGNGMITNHTYRTAGRYRVTLTVKDEDVDAETDSIMRIVTVYRRDVAIVAVTAHPTKVAVGSSVSINVTVLNKGGFTETFNVTVYYDTLKIETQTVNILPSGANTTLTFVWDTTGLATGEYVLKAEASTVPDETDVTNNSFIIGQVTLGILPSAFFTYSPSTPVVDEMITFNGSKSTANGGVISQSMWDFGDNITGWGIILEHSYATWRTYNVKLTIVDSDGLTNSATRNVTVRAIPVASFTYAPTVPKVGEVITFNGSSSYNPEGSTIVSFTWDFGDDVNGTGIIETHTYTNPETYVVTLTVKDAVGNEDMESVTITVAEAPSFSLWKPEALGVVVAAVAIGSVLTVLFFRKRTVGTKSQ